MTVRLVSVTYHIEPGAGEDFFVGDNLCARRKLGNGNAPITAQFDISITRPTTPAGFQGHHIQWEGVARKEPAFRHDRNDVATQQIFNRAVDVFRGITLFKYNG